MRADSCFCRDALMTWCEAVKVDHLFGLVRNARLTGEIDAELEEAADEFCEIAKPARRFKDFMWTTLNSWRCWRRVVAKAEVTHGDINPRLALRRRRTLTNQTAHSRTSHRIQPGNPWNGSARPPPVKNNQNRSS